MERKKLILLMVLAALIVAPAAEAGIADIQYVIGIGTNSNASGSRNTVTTASNNDTKWDQLSGLGTNKLTGTKLSKGQDVDGDGTIDAYIVFDFEMYLSVPDVDGDDHGDYFTKYDSDTLHDLDDTLSTRRKYDGTKGTVLTMEDELNFKISNFYVSDTLGGDAWGQYKIQNFEFADFMCISRNSTADDRKFKTTYNGSAAVVSGLMNNTTDHVRLNTDYDIIDGAEGTLRMHNGTTAANYRFTNMRLDFNLEYDESYVVPEPATLGLLGMGSMMFLAGRKKRKA